MTITYAHFYELVKRRLQNDFAGAEFTVTDNEVGIYLYPAVATVITQLAKQEYAVEGIYPELNIFNLTYKFSLSSLTEDADTGEYTLTLPQVPVGLPEGVAIKSPTIIGVGKRSFPLIYITTSSRNFALKMPTPSYGAYWYYEGDKLTIISNEDLINSGLKLSLTMLSSRGAKTDTMNLSDDAFSMVFDIVVAKLTQRISQPKDKINDGSDKKTEAA